jgi:hypothetical protein
MEMLKSSLARTVQARPIGAGGGRDSRPPPCLTCLSAAREIQGASDQYVRSAAELEIHIVMASTLRPSPPR